MELGVISFRNAASFRNQAQLLCKRARQEGYEVKDLTLQDVTVGPPKHRFDKFIAIIPLWPRYIFDIKRVCAFGTRQHLVYGPVDGPFQMNLGLFQVMKGINLCTPSQWCADMIRRSSGHSALVCPHGIDPKDFTFSQDRIEGQRKVWLEGSKADTVLFANLNPIHRKGFPHLCQAIGKLYEAIGDKFLFILHTRLSLARKLYERIDKVPCLRIEDTYNTLPFRAVALKTVAADIYVNPSHQEGFGLPILESMAANTCLVTPEYAPITEFVTDKEAFLFPITRVKEEKWNNGFLAQLHMYSVTALADAMQQAIENPKLRKEKAAAAYERSKAYDYQTVYSKLIKMCG